MGYTHSPDNPEPDTMSALQTLLKTTRKKRAAATQGEVVAEITNVRFCDGSDGVEVVHNHGIRSWSQFFAVAHVPHAHQENGAAHRNMQFIAHAANTIETLCDVVDVLREALEQYATLDDKDVGTRYLAKHALEKAEKLAGGK